MLRGTYSWHMECQTKTTWHQLTGLMWHTID
jgi:hypothetical protein